MDCAAPGVAERRTRPSGSHCQTCHAASVSLCLCSPASPGMGSERDALPPLRAFVQFSSVAQSCPLCDPMDHSMTGLHVHHQLLKLAQTHVHRGGDAIQPSHPLSSPSPPAPNPSQHQSLSNESTFSMRWTKYWSFSFSIIPSKEHPQLIAFRMDWLDLLAVQGTLKSLLQHHSSKTLSLFQGIFPTQELKPYITGRFFTI